MASSNFGVIEYFLDENVKQGDKYSICFVRIIVLEQTPLRK